MELDYDPLPAVVDVDVAFADHGPFVYPEFGSNRCYTLSYTTGDLDAAFADADVVVQRTLRIPRLIPSPMETRAVVAQPLPRGEFALWTSTQVPHVVRRTIAPCVGIPEEQLRVIVPDVGGAFGVKLNVYAEEALMLALARRLERPVKWIESRSESHLASTHGRGQVQRMELAAREDGKLLAVKASMIASMGAYLQLETPGIPALGKFLCAGVYHADAYAFEVTGVFTNQTPTGAYRGVGRAEAIYAIERMMDVLAREIDVDPAEVRRRNYLPRGEKVTNAAGIPYDSVDLEATLDRALQLIGYDELRQEQASRRAKRHSHELGIGIVSYVDSCGAGPSPIMALSNYRGGAWESGRVRVLSSGRIEVLAGIVPQGQGHDTVLAQITADVLGVTPDDVKVLHGDTASSPRWGGDVQLARSRGRWDGGAPRR
ncbi:MAG: molybdopterin cofactor-binding domain-containing protein [Actinomycetota bacterium]